jgi:hypothetical protein
MALPGGFPNFHQADYGQGIVYGTILLHHHTVEWRDVLEDAYNIFTNFTFDRPLQRPSGLRFWSVTALPFTALADAAISRDTNMRICYRPTDAE